MEVLTALQRTSARPDATQKLGLGASLADEVRANMTLTQAAAAPAAEVYTGVLYAAAGLADLSGTARRRANSAVRIVSGLWGVLTPNDRIPGYRLPMGARLDDFEPLAAFWAPRLRAVLEPEDASGSDLVLDCRSGAYLPAWTPAPHRPWLSVRVVAEADGVRKVVSHHAKHTRGVLTHHSVDPDRASAADLWPGAARRPRAHRHHPNRCRGAPHPGARSGRVGTGRRRLRHRRPGWCEVSRPAAPGCSRSPLSAGPPRPVLR